MWKYVISMLRNTRKSLSKLKVCANPIRTNADARHKTTFFDEEKLIRVSFNLNKSMCYAKSYI